jgi:hypothetical protein
MHSYMLLESAMRLPLFSTHMMVLRQLLTWVVKVRIQ